MDMGRWWTNDNPGDGDVPQVYPVLRVHNKILRRESGVELGSHAEKDESYLESGGLDDRTNSIL